MKLMKHKLAFLKTRYNNGDDYVRKGITEIVEAVAVVFSIRIIIRELVDFFC